MYKIRLEAGVKSPRFFEKVFHFQKNQHEKGPFKVDILNGPFNYYYPLDYTFLIFRFFWDKTLSFRWSVPPVLEFLINFKANHYVSGGLYLPFIKI